MKTKLSSVERYLSTFSARGEVWFLTPFSLPNSCREVSTGKGVWELSSQCFQSLQHRREGWGSVMEQPTDNTWHIFENPTKGETFVSPFSSFQTTSISSDTPQTEEASPAEVVCIIEFSSPGPGPCGYQVNSQRICAPTMLVYPTIFVHTCTCMYF